MIGGAYGTLAKLPTNSVNGIMSLTGATPTITTTATNPTNLNSIPFTVTFNEDVTGFTAAGLSVTNVGFLLHQAMQELQKELSHKAPRTAISGARSGAW